VGLIALGSYLWQLTVPIYLQLYDSGVYLSASIHLVSGVWPYRDFAFVQPPGILLILSPVAMIGRLVGTHEGYVAARVMSAVTTALNASLLSWLLRRYGRLAMSIGGMALALTPVAVFYSSEIRLEPYCFLFILLGSLKIANVDWRRGSPPARPLLVAGSLFGIAAAVEFWAFFAFVAMTICLVPAIRRRVFAFVAGAAIGLAVPCLPFLVIAPHDFFIQVFVEQLHHPRFVSSIWHRMVDITGLSGTAIAPSGPLALGGLIILITLGVVLLSKGRRGGVIEWYLLVSTIACALGLLVAPASYTDYGYFAAPFLAGLVAVEVARMADLARHPRVRDAISQPVRRFLIGAGVATTLSIVAGAVAFDATFYSLDLPLTGVNEAAITSLSRMIPKGSCVVYDTVGMGLLANRFISTDAHCPRVVDPYGAAMGWGYLRASSDRGVAFWRSNLSAARYLVVAVPIDESRAALAREPFQGMIPWNANLLDWFARHYHLVGCRPECVYRHAQ